MNISVDGVVLLTLTPTQKNIIKNDISADVLDEEIKRRLCYIIEHKIEQCMKSLKEEWVDGGKLVANGVSSIPIDDMALADIIFAQPNYKDKKTRNLE